MKKNLIKINLLIIVLAFFSSCNLTKRIDNNQIILKNIDIKLNEKLIKSDSLNPLITVKENSKILGIPFPALIGSSAKLDSDSLFQDWLNKKNKRKRLKNLLSEKQLKQLKRYYTNFNNWKFKNGENIEIIDSVKIENSVKNLNLYFQNLGYLKNEIDFEVKKESEKNADLIFQINTLGRYYIANNESNIDSKIIDSIYKANSYKSKLKDNSFFNSINFDIERNRLFNLFKNNGVYDFQINSILFSAEIDSSDNNLSIPIKTNIYDKNYSISKVSAINIIQSDSSNSFNFNKNFIKSKLKFKSGDVFNDSLRKASLRELNDLDLFNFPSIQYSKKNDNSLAANLLLNSKKKFGLGFGFDLKQSNIEDIGIAFENRFKSRNIFRRGENLILSFTGSIGKSGKTQISQINYDLMIDIPRFLLGSKETSNGGISNKRTFINLGSSNQRNIGLDRNSFKLNYTYSWNSKKTFFSFSPAEIALINNKNIGNYFNIYSSSYKELNFIAGKITSNPIYYNNGDLEIPQGINLFIDDVLDGKFNSINEIDFRKVSFIEGRRSRLISNNLILGPSIKLSNKSEKVFQGNNFNRWNIKIQTSGNIASLFAKKDNSQNFKTISDLRFSQFFKTEFSYIRHWSFENNSLFAFRFFNGLAIPYGNSENIPFSESFFGGGSNDNRAWQVYKLGPGSSGAFDEFNEANFKIAFNFEYRFKMFGNFDGAFFTDVGNIWNLLDNTEDSSRTFDGFSDLSELAIGNGVGLRYDSGLFIFRLDMGLKTHNPSLEKGKRWLTDFSLKKAVFNIGLNYPF
jgi:outer membrane protein assembly factor BamA